jgi:hypothetical protein
MLPQPPLTQTEKKTAQTHWSPVILGLDGTTHATEVHAFEDERRLDKAISILGFPERN